MYEDATQGRRIYPTFKLKKVILIPQYHARPFVTSTIFNEVIFTNYACDIMPTEPGRPDPKLLRLTRALSDETRLVILRLLAGKQLSFSEIVREVKLSKSTIHYHLIFLRAAGLVLVHYDHKKISHGYSKLLRRRFWYIFPLINYKWHNLMQEYIPASSFL
ncbi:ArsR/SmtB family transcription factor [Paenibacillus amylolyticus]|uniref:ArsR/SmtB family transcription factor n=1 Tax=Paenibacillus amylolyticus TaxID=1451 RepID=UPI003EBD9BCB